MKTESIEHINNTIADFTGLKLVPVNKGVDKPKWWVGDFLTVIDTSIKMGAGAKVLEFDHNLKWLIPAFHKFRRLKIPIEKLELWYGHANRVHILEDKLKEASGRGSIRRAAELLAEEINWYNNSDK